MWDCCADPGWDEMGIGLKLKWRLPPGLPSLEHGPHGDWSRDFGHTFKVGWFEMDEHGGEELRDG
jgi:hypothetical protein